MLKKCGMVLYNMKRVTAEDAESFQVCVRQHAFTINHFTKSHYHIIGSVKQTKPPVDHLLTLLPPFILKLYFFSRPPKLCLSSSVVLSPDAGGTLVLVFIPTWLTNRLLTVILTRTNFLSGHNALLLI